MECDHLSKQFNLLLNYVEKQMLPSELLPDAEDVCKTSSPSDTRKVFAGTLASLESADANFEELPLVRDIRKALATAEVHSLIMSHVVEVKQEEWVGPRRDQIYSQILDKVRASSPFRSVACKL